MIKVKEFRRFGLVWLVFFVYNNEGERDYGAILADIKSHNDFTKIILIEFYPKFNPNHNAIVGYVQMHTSY